MPIDPAILPSDDEKDEELSRAYIRFQYLERESPEYDALFWTFDRMSFIREYFPHKAWRVILLIWSMDQSPLMIQNLCFGPLKDILIDHTAEILPMVEAEARRNVSFRELLGGLSQFRISDEIWPRVQSAKDQIPWDGACKPNLIAPLDSHSNPTLLPREDEKDDDLARAWIALQKAERGSTEHSDLFWSHERIHYLTRYLPRKAWRVTLLIWSMDQSFKTMGNLSAGPMEDLIDCHGDEMIGLVEAEAHRDPSFAKMLGGMWQSGSEEVWARLQAVWDRRGWDGIPEE